MVMKSLGRGRKASVTTEKANAANERILVFGQDQALQYSEKVRREGNTWTADDLGLSFPRSLHPIPFLRLNRVGRAPVPTGRRIMFAFKDTANAGADDNWVIKTLSNIRLAAEEGRRPDQQAGNKVANNLHTIAGVLGVTFALIMLLPLAMGALERSF